jgi:hypothetical protein
MVRLKHQPVLSNISQHNYKLLINVGTFHGTSLHLSYMATLRQKRLNFAQGRSKIVTKIKVASTHCDLLTYWQPTLCHRYIRSDDDIQRTIK